MADYTFIPMTKADLPLFKDWLSNPHIDGWWGDGGTEARLVAEEFETGRVDMRLACLDGTPFAYIQDYNAHEWDAPHYVDQHKDARAIDTFLGDPAYLGRGHGSGYIAARVSELRRNYPIVLTDPDPKNTRAIAAYTRAGFQPLDIRPCEDGDPVLVMRAS